MRKTLQNIPDLANKSVLLRVDFDVPVDAVGKIQEPFRIVKQKETVDYLIAAGAHVVMVAHISDVDSFHDLLPQLSEYLGRQIEFLDELEDIPPHLANISTIALLDNIRKFDGEIRNDDEFAKKLATGFDLYVNNAFAVSHRAHASVSAITRHLPSYSGFQVEAEVSQLEKVIGAPAMGKVVVMGGAKASTKVPVIQNFIGKSDAVLVGGVIANDILKAKGFDVGQSKVDQNVSELLGTLDLKAGNLFVPHDFNIADNKILDIGPQTIQKFEDIIRHSKMVIWNGPMGLFEDEHFAKGTDAIARIILASGATSILGGGDTISAVSRLGILDKFTFVSTGGGAMLEFLAGNALPGIVALNV